MSDSQLDREIASAVGIEPSPEFVARVRTRITTEREASPWRLSFEPLWGVAIAGIVLAVVVPRFMREEVMPPAVERLVARGVVDDPVVGGPDRTDVHVDPGRSPAVRRDVVQGTRQLRLSRPMFSDDERLALAMLVTAVAEGRVPPAPVEVIAPGVAASIPELPAIESLAIAPLPLLARIDDARAPAEGERE